MVTDEMAKAMEEEYKEQIKLHKGDVAMRKAMTMEEEYRNADVPMPNHEIIKSLEARNTALLNFTEILSKELERLRTDNKKLTKQVNDMLEQFRNKGGL